MVRWSDGRRVILSVCLSVGRSVGWSVSQTNKQLLSAAELFNLHRVVSQDLTTHHRLKTSRQETDIQKSLNAFVLSSFIIF